MKTGPELLSSLKSRRTGADRLHLLDSTQRASVIASQLLVEAYETRASGAHTRYALGAMEPVSDNYTRISIQTAGRVEGQLETRLPAAGYSVTFRRQGSVPLNVHIRGVSDVDLLVIETRSLYFDNAGVRAIRSDYPPAATPPLTILAGLRNQCERDLRAAYHTATVDTSGAKAIKISGGSLPRAVDVVPAVWWDTVDYQATRSETFRGVSIYNRRENSTIKNLPFLHIHRVDERCRLMGGSLRKAIRLCKNVKADLEDEGNTIGLSSYDIAGVMYHADQAAMRLGAVYPLAVLAETQRHLDALWVDKERARALMTPDGLRRIFDVEGKFNALLTLSTAFDKLLEAVAKEQSPSAGPLRENYRRAVQSLAL